MIRLLSNISNFIINIMPPKYDAYAYLSAMPSLIFAYFI